MRKPQLEERYGKLYKIVDAMSRQIAAMPDDKEAHKAENFVELCKEFKRAAGFVLDVLTAAELDIDRDRDLLLTPMVINHSHIKAKDSSTPTDYWRTTAPPMDQSSVNDIQDLDDVIMGNPGGDRAIDSSYDNYDPYSIADTVSDDDDIPF